MRVRSIDARRKSYDTRTKNRILQAKENDCSFDGMPIHPNNYRHLIWSGFKTVSEIEALTSNEFMEKVDNSKKPSGEEFASKNVGKRLRDNLIKNGVRFRQED